MKIQTLVAMIALAILLTACTPETKEYTPDVRMTLSPSSVVVKTDQASDFITVTLEKLDDNPTPATFEILLATPNAEEIFFVGEDGNPVSVLPTQELKIKGDRKSYRFKIQGKRLGSSDFTPYTLGIHLRYNGKVLDAVSQPLSVRVTA